MSLLTGACVLKKTIARKSALRQRSALLCAMVFHEIADGVYTFPRACAQCFLCVYEIILTGARISVRARSAAGDSRNACKALASQATFA